MSQSWLSWGSENCLDLARARILPNQLAGWGEGDRGKLQYSRNIVEQLTLNVVSWFFIALSVSTLALP